MNKLLVRIIALLSALLLISGCGKNDIVDEYNYKDDETIAVNETTTETKEEDTVHTIQTREEMENVLNEICSELEVLVDEYEKTYEHGEKTVFKTDSELVEFSKMYITLSQMTDGIIRIFEENKPLLYSMTTEWEDSSDRLYNIKSLFMDSSEFDTNGNGEIESEELSDLVNNTNDEFCAEMSIILDNYTKMWDDLRTGSSESIDEDKCVKCGKTATKIHVELLSKEQRYYCDKCYEQLMDKLDALNSDTGNDSGYRCLSCGKEAFYSINGLTGQKEYYCYKCYNELVDILAKMEDDVEKAKSKNNE